MFFDHLFSLHRKDSRNTWKNINSVIGRQCKKGANLPNFFEDNKIILHGDEKISNGFNNFFIHAGPNLDLKIPHSDTSFKHYLGSSNPSNFMFKLQSQSDVLYFISKLKGKTSYGFDLISNKVLKIIAPHIISPLTHILNLSLQNGTVASPFKITKVVPVFKGENKHFFTNYRPISLLSSFSKLLERIVAKQLIDFLIFH